MSELYDLLGVARDASKGDIKKAYRDKVKTAHPDAGGDEKAFSRIQEAYEVLSDPDRRARYDRTGRTDKPTVTPESIQAVVDNTVAAIINAERPDGTTDDPRWEDIRSKVLMTIRNGRREIQVNLKREQKRMRRLDSLMSRFRSRTSADPVGDAFARQKKQLQRGIHQLEDSLEMNLELEKVFQSYDYEVGPGTEGHDEPGPTLRLTGGFSYFTSTTSGG